MKSLIGRRFVSMETFLLRLMFFALVIFFKSPLYSCVLSKRSEVLSKISENHPVLATKNKRLEVSKAGVATANQSPNPILNFTSNHGQQGGIDSSETTGNLLYVFELGGKKSSRVEFAKAREKLGKVQILNQTEKILIESSLMLTRMDQVEALLGLYKESLEVFIKMRKSLSRNKQLSPEQRIQLDIVEMEVSKHRLRISNLENEFKQVSSFLNLYMGQNCQVKTQGSQLIVPDPTSINIDHGQSPDLKEMRWYSKSLEFDFLNEDSKAYPDLKIGPSFQIEDQGLQTINRFGLSLKMDLPILNRNQGGRALAESNKNLTQAQLSFKEKENNVVLSTLLESYRTTYETLRLVPKKADLLEKHHRIEKLFLRGLISIPTMIDGHDQLLSLMEQRDEQELLVLKTYLKLSQANDELQKALHLGGSL